MKRLVGNEAVGSVKAAVGAEVKKKPVELRDVYENFVKTYPKRMHPFVRKWLKRWEEHTVSISRGHYKPRA